MKTLTFAIDYDGTLTADPSLWAAFVNNVKVAGHRIFLVTARRNTVENTDDIYAFLDHWGCQMPVVFSDTGSKLHAVENCGLDVDIWIDDDPKRLVNGL